MDKPSPFFTNLKCRECGRLYPKQAIHVCDFDFGPLEAAYDYDAIRPVLTREVDRVAPAIDVALPRAAADRRRADGRHAGRLHAAGQGGSARQGARHPRALRQERHGQLPHAFVQGSRRLRRAEPRARARLQDRRLRLDRQSRQLRRRQCRERRAEKLRAHPRRSRAGQSARLARLWHERRRHPRRLRSGQPPLLRDRRQIRLGLCEREPAPVLRRGLEVDGLRDLPSNSAGASRSTPSSRWPPARCSRRSTRPTTSSPSSGSWTKRPSPSTARRPPAARRSRTR